MNKMSNILFKISGRGEIEITLTKFSELCFFSLSTFNGFKFKNSSQNLVSEYNDKYSYFMLFTPLVSNFWMLYISEILELEI